MSSISPAERSKNVEDVRGVREDYDDRELALIKKQKRELKRAAEQNDKTIQELKDEFARQIAELKSRSRESLTEKDERHQKNIDQVRNLYTEQLRRKQVEAKDINDGYKQTYEDKVRKEKDIAEQQRSGLKRDFDESLRDRDREFKGLAEKSRDIIQTSIADRTNKLGEKHNVEIHSVTTDRDDKLAHAREVQDQMKLNYEGRIKDQNRDQESKLRTLNMTWNEKLKKEQENTTEGYKLRDATFQASRRNMVDQFLDKTKKKMEEIQATNDNLKDTVNQRVENEVKSAQVKAQRAQDEVSRTNVSSRRLSDLERKDLINAYEQRMGLIQEEKRGIFEAAKTDREEKISKVIEQQTKILQDSNLEHRMDMNMLNTRNREDRGQLEVNLASKMDHVKDRADIQVKRVLNSTNKTVEGLDKMHRESLDQAKNNFQGSLAEQREAQTGALQKTTAIMESRLRDLELKQMSKLDTMKGNYETQIEKVLDDHKKEMKKLEEAFASRTKQEQKAQRTEIESINQKNETKFGQLEEMHQKEIERQEKRHQEQINSLAKQVSYYKKNS